MTQQVDTIFTNALIVTMNANYDVIPQGAVAVRGDEIVAVGTAAEINKAYSAAELIDCEQQVLMPGLVNAHTHIPMTLLRGLNDDLRLDVWLGYLMPLERHFVTPEFVKLGARLACAEMIRSGITAFADMYYFEEAIAEETAAIGMRALLGQTVLMFPAPDAESYEDALELCRNFIEGWNGHPLIQPAVSPHAWYTATPELLQACGELAREFDVPVHTHIAETAIEVENAQNQHHTTVVDWNAQNGLLDTKLLAAHCVHINRGEMQQLKAAEAGVAHNPTSNLKLSSGIAPVVEMLQVGLNVGIGTDGPASNNDLDMFEEMRLAALLAKVVKSDPTDLPAKEALTLATIGGARALHMGHLTGSLEVGKRADLIVVDMRDVHNWPHFYNSDENVYSRLVYAAKSTDVEHVMCNGRFLMRGRQLLTVDEAQAMAAATEVAAEVDAFVLRRESSVYNKLITLAPIERQENYEVQAKFPLEEPDLVLRVLSGDEFEITKHTQYDQYDCYFNFEDDPDASRLRYREDNYLNEIGQITHSRARLTLLGHTHYEFSDRIMLSRSRYLTAAPQSLRFYREYFNPDSETTIHKIRRRWRILYKETDFAINLDKMKEPAMAGYFLEIKSRTWSRKDAEIKAALIAELAKLFGVSLEVALPEEYVAMVTVG